MSFTPWMIGLWGSGSRLKTEEMTIRPPADDGLGGPVSAGIMCWAYMLGSPVLCLQLMGPSFYWARLVTKQAEIFLDSPDTQQVWASLSQTASPQFNHLALLGSTQLAPASLGWTAQWTEATERWKWTARVEWHRTWHDCTLHFSIFHSQIW